MIVKLMKGDVPMWLVSTAQPTLTAFHRDGTQHIEVSLSRQEAADICISVCVHG